MFLTACSGKTEDAAEARRLTLLYSNNVNGDIEPCG